MRTLALDCPTWAEIDRESASLTPDGPYEARAGRYVWHVVDTRTGQIRATAPRQGEARERVDELNRAEAAL